MFKKRANKIIIDYVSSQYEKIEVAPGKCELSQVRNSNVVDYAVKAGDEKITLCVCVGNNVVFAHFVNVNNEGKYTDHTFGMWSRNWDYYKIKDIFEEDLFDVPVIVGRFVKTLRRKLPLFVRLLCKNLFWNNVHRSRNKN